MVLDFIYSNLLIFAKKINTIRVLMKLKKARASFGYLDKRVYGSYDELCCIFMMDEFDINNYKYETAPFVDYNNGKPIHYCTEFKRKNGIGRAIYKIPPNDRTVIAYFTMNFAKFHGGSGRTIKMISNIIMGGEDGEDE